MYLLEQRRANGNLKSAVANLRPFPDPAHVGKCIWDGLCNWAVLLDDHRTCMQFLRTLREDTNLPDLPKHLPLFPLTCRDQQAPENLLYASTEPVLSQLRAVQHVCHQLCPEKWRKWDGNNRELEHPLAVATHAHRLAFMESSNRISLGNWHTPFDVKQSSSAEAKAHGLAFVDNVLFVTVPGSAEIQYLEAKAGSSEAAVGSMRVADLRRELHDRDEDTTGLDQTAMRRILKGRLEQEREAKFGVDPGADEKERKQNRSTRPRLRKLVLEGDLLRKPLAIAAHPSERRLAVTDGSSRRVAVIELRTQGVQLIGSCRFVCESISPDAQLNSMCWVSDDMLVVADSSPSGGLWSVDVAADGTHHLQLRSGSLNVDGQQLPMKPWGVCSSAGRLYYTDVAERTVREYTMDSEGGQAVLRLIAGSGSAGTRDGIAVSSTFVQPTAIASDGGSLVVCDSGSGRICVISQVAPLISLLERLRLLYETFGLHLRGKTVARRSLADGIANLSAIAEAVETHVAAVRERVDKDTVNGPDGAISNDCRQSLRIMHESLVGVRDLFSRVVEEDESAVDYQSCFALKACGQQPVERFFSKMHAAVPMPTALQYCQTKAQTGLELIKQLTRCPFYYPISKQFYPDIDLALAFSAIDLPRKKTTEKQKMVRLHFTDEENRRRREYLGRFFRPAPQSTVRSICKFRAGTPPLSTFAHRVELKSQAMDLERRADDMSDNAGLPLPERERNADPADPADDSNFVFLAVLPGGQPEKLLEEDLYVVAVDAASYDNKQYDPLAGYWMVPNDREPQVFRYMAKANLQRRHILAEISVEAYQDKEDFCAAVDETTLHLLLVKARRSAEEGSAQHEDDPRLESDAFPFFGVSQRSKSVDGLQARKERASRRRAKAPSQPKAKSAAKPKAKPGARPKKGATKGGKHSKRRAAHDADSRVDPLRSAARLGRT